MRIIAGQWRGTVLRSPPGHQTRPVLDQVKEAAFNILGARLAEPGRLPPCRVLDVFCGTGSFGLEALSRGAEGCVFVEQHRGTAAVLKQNIAAVHAEDACDVRITDAWRARPEALASEAPHGLIFVDPPYPDVERDPARVVRLVEHLLMPRLLAPHGILLLRHPRRSAPHTLVPATAVIHDHRTHGDMTLTFVGPGGCSAS